MKKRCFEDTDKDGNNLPFDDGCHIMYVNGAYRGNDAIGHLMYDFCTANANEMKYITAKLQKILQLYTNCAK